MEITDIRLTKKKRYSVYIDGEFSFVLHPDVFATSSISAGAQAEPAQLAELQRKSLERFAKDRALKLLSARAYTQKKLYDKLLEHVEDEEIVQSVVLRMAELGLVDDADYARRFALDCINLKHYSISRTAMALREKGISKEIIEATLDSLDYNPEPLIARLILRKYRRYLEDEKGIVKTVNALQRLGYRYGDIKTVLANLAQDEDYYNEEQ